MSIPDRLLEHHSVLIRDGRILDILPSDVARAQYAASVVVQRPSHLLMPGMINSRTHDAIDESTPPSAASERDRTLPGIAAMLRAGITCYADRPHFPHESAHAAAQQGIRVVVGLSVAEHPLSLTQALSFRDEYGGHPLVSTAFAPHSANHLTDATLSKLVTLSNELDAGVLMDVHASASEVQQSLAMHGMRPLQRLWNLGLLSPGLNAAHMAQVTEEDIALAQRSGISVSLCLQGDLRRGNGLAPVAAFTAGNIRLGLASAGYASLSLDVWGEMRLAALLSNGAQALQAATCGGAAVLGLDREIGTLETGKWADLCCLDLAGAAMQPLHAPLDQIVFNGGRDLVSDVWVAGRQLLSAGELTRALPL
jgi:5-methylthioadenosine/S-adenosylhomocysteine deaminase